MERHAGFAHVGYLTCAGLLYALADLKTLDDTVTCVIIGGHGASAEGSHQARSTLFSPEGHPAATPLQ